MTLQRLRFEKCDRTYLQSYFSLSPETTMGYTV